MSRRAFTQRLRAVLGDTRLLWLPSMADAATSRTDEPPTGRVVTWDASVYGRMSQLGRGLAQTFTAPSNYGTMPDTADMTFGNGITDQPFSVVGLVNVTDTAGTKTIAGKYQSGVNPEWLFRIDANEQLQLFLGQKSTLAVGNVLSNAPVNIGVWALLGMTYTGLGGATAMNGVTLYQNGASIALTVVNAGTYVAMEDTTEVPCIGALFAGFAGQFAGSMALVAVCAKALTGADHAALAALCRQYFGVAL